MKRAVSLVFLVVLVCTTSLPSLGQRSLRGSQKKGPLDHSPTTTQTATQFGKLRALTDGSGVTLVTWQMTAEQGSFAFNVFRVDANGKHLVGGKAINSESMLSYPEPVFGERYGILDSEGSFEAAYFVENVAVDGRNVFSDVAGTEFIEDFSKFEEEFRKAERLDRIAPVIGNDLVLDKELTRLVESGRTEADIDTHRWVITQPGVKIGTKKDGLYRVTRAELEAGGFNVNGDPANWQLYEQGVQQSLIVGPNGDYIEFLGRGLDTVESDTRAYFLINGPSAGKRMATRVSRPSTGTVIDPSFSQTFTFKERTGYVNQIRNGDAENFFGRPLLSNPVLLNFVLSGVDYNRPSSVITLKLQGFSSGLHQVNLTLNGQALSPMISAGQVAYSTTQSIPTSLLINGTNTLQMQSVGPAGDISLFDTIQVTFDRQHFADQNKLFFYTENDRKAYVTGFTSSDVRLFDTTFETEPYEVTNLSVESDGPLYKLNVPAQRAATFYASEVSALNSVSSIEPFDPEMLGVPTHSADLVIITHKNFLAEADNWANYRRNQGITVKVVNVAQVYEEFNYGVLKADAIKTFLQYAHTNWLVTPGYVLFIGDAHFDPRNYSGNGYVNYVPTRMVNTLFSETGSDEFLADFNNDGLAEMAVGRIPTGTAAAAAVVLAKVGRWELNLTDPLQRGVLFAFDEPVGYDFEGMSNRLRNQLPAGTPTTMVGKPAPDSLSTLVAEISEGKYFANYSGHGNVTSWSSNWFTATNVMCTGGTQCVNNVNNEFAFTMLTCLNAYFVTTGDSLGETLIFTQNGGAVAAWASTGLTTADVQEVMGQRFYQQLGVGNITRLGDLIKDAKTQIPGGMDVRLSWALLGDPMLKLR